MLTFTVEDQEITRTDTEKVIAGSVNYVQAVFIFDEAWSGLTITAYFQIGSIRRAVMDVKSGVAVTVPWEVLRPGNLHVYVEGYDGTVRLTAARMRRPVRIFASGRGHCSEPAGVPSKDVYEQLLDAFQASKELVQEVYDDAQSGNLDGKGLEFLWDGTCLGVRKEGQQDYLFSDLIGDSGVYVGSGEVPSGCRVQIDPEGSASRLVLSVNGVFPDETGDIAAQTVISNLKLSNFENDAGYASEDYVEQQLFFSRETDLFTDGAFTQWPGNWELDNGGYSSVKTEDGVQITGGYTLQQKISTAGLSGSLIFSIGGICNTNGIYESMGQAYSHTITCFAGDTSVTYTMNGGQEYADVQIEIVLPALSGQTIYAGMSGGNGGSESVTEIKNFRLLRTEEASGLAETIELHNGDSSAHPLLEERLAKLEEAASGYFFANYQAMLAAISAQEPLVPGQTIYIEDAGSIDVWISENTNSFLGVYEYTTDAQLMADLKNTGFIVHRGHVIRPVKAIERT